MAHWLRRVRGRSTEEQMLATMLVAGVVFAIVALVAFMRPGGQSSASVAGPNVRTAHTGADASAPQGSSTHIAIQQGVQADQPAASTGSQTITQKLQRLFGAVVTPFGFTTDLPPLIKTRTTPVSASNPNSFPSTFQPLPGTLPPPPPTLPPPPPSLPPTTDTLPPPTTQPPTTLPPTTQPPTTLPPTTQPPTTQPPTTLPPTTQPPTTDTQPPTTDTQPPTTDTQPATTSSTDTILPGVPLP